MWKAFMPRMVTAYADQISEHQRDLTGSASGRFMLESLAAIVIASDRLSRVMDRIAVDKEKLSRNFSMSRRKIVAEPLYLLLAYYGHPDAHEFVRKLTVEADKSNQDVGK